jgi:hypothetical protein
MKFINYISASWVCIGFLTVRGQDFFDEDSNAGPDVEVAPPGAITTVTVTTTQFVISGFVIPTASVV